MEAIADAIGYLSLAIFIIGLSVVIALYSIGCIIEKITTTSVKKG